MTPTPRTDAQAKTTIVGIYHEPNFVSADFARELEREIVEANDELRVIRTSVPDSCEVIGSVAGTVQNYIVELEGKNDAMTASLELADKELEASGYGSGTLPRKAIAEALYG